MAGVASSSSSSATTQDGPSGATDVLNYPNIIIGGRQASQQGVLKVAPSGLLWRSKTTSKQLSIPKQDLLGMDWFRTPKGYLIRNRMKAGTCVEFAGFKESDYNRLNDFVQQHYNLNIEKVEVTSKGGNWGDMNIVGNLLTFNFDGKQAFEISLSDVSNTSVQKNELTLEFHQDDTENKEDESLVEVRFILPPKGADDDEEPAEKLDRQIKEKGDILGPASEDTIVTFDQLAFLTPRGRYNIEMFHKYMRLRGKTYDFKILYSSISTMFLLPKPGVNFMFFVISLDTAIRHGQTPYFHLVMHFDKDEIYDEKNPLKLNISKEDLQTKYEGKGIGATMSGPVFEVVAKIFRGLTSKKIIGPGSFLASNGVDKGIKCSFGASEGFLFLLEKSFFFLHKPPTYIKHDDVKSVKFQRADNRGGGSRYFDVSIFLRKGKTLTFSNLQKKEYDPLVAFLTKKNLTIENIKEEASSNNIGGIDFGDDDTSDEEDADFAPGEESDDDEDMKDLVPETDDVTTTTTAKRKRDEDEEDADENNNGDE